MAVRVDSNGTTHIAFATLTGHLYYATRAIGQTEWNTEIVVPKTNWSKAADT